MHLDETTALEALKERYPNLVEDEGRITIWDEKAYIQVQDMRADKKVQWTKPRVLFVDVEINPELEKLKRFQMATRSILERLQELNYRKEALRNAARLQEVVEEKDREIRRIREEAAKSQAAERSTLVREADIQLLQKEALQQK